MARAAELTVDVLLAEGDLEAALADDARAGLTATPKVLSPIWFYDERGSQLFDEITRLPEYYLTDAERELLRSHAEEIATVTKADTLVELGSGTSEKTRTLLDALEGAGTLERYAPLDVSEETLRRAAHELVAEYDGLEVHAVVGDFHRHLSELPAGARRIVAFLGSTIGNLSPPERSRLLFDLDCALNCDDWLLLGADLVKDPDRLLAAYNDDRGVTAEFNRNALRVLNATLEADFDPDRFDHVVIWNEEHERIEMHLRANRAHRVRVGVLGLDVGFEQGETVRTETSAKFREARLVEELETAGFVVERRWRSEDFLLVLARPYC